MDQEQLKLKAYQNFDFCFAEKGSIDKLEMETDQEKNWLVEWFFDNRNYAMEEYYSARILIGQMAASAREPVKSLENVDAVWATKFKNFSSLKALRERLEQLEGELFKNNTQVIDVISGAKKEALFKASAADEHKGEMEL